MFAPFAVCLLLLRLTTALPAQVSAQDPVDPAHPNSHVVLATPETLRSSSMTNSRAGNTDFPHLPYIASFFPGVRHPSHSHPDGWSLSEYNLFLDRAAAKFHTTKGDADYWDVVPDERFVYQERDGSGTKFSFEAREGRARPVVWGDVVTALAVLRKEGQEAQGNIGVQEFYYRVGKEGSSWFEATDLARGYFGDADLDAQGVF